MTDLAVVGDIGGTNARFALVRPGDGRPEIEACRSYLCRDYASPEAALDNYLQAHSAHGRPSAVVLAVAGPVIDGAARFTNSTWTVSEAGLRAAGFAWATLINDFEALAMAVPWLGPDDSVALGPPGRPARGRTLAVLGPGTGFGAAAFCQDADGAAVLTGEGGHIGFAPRDETEVQVWRILARRFGRVSVERILCGAGLINLHQALCEIHGVAVTLDEAADVTARARAGDPVAAETVRRFCTILGAVCGDFALAYGAVGGVYLAGGIAPRMMAELSDGGFRAAFEDKGRYAGYLAAIPTRVIVHPYLALLGAARALAPGRDVGRQA
jgi:glucokinase